MAWIAGERVVLRAWERDDVRVRWEAAQTPDATGERLRNWHEPPRSLVEAEQEFEANQSEPDPNLILLIIDVDGRPVGDIAIFEIERRSQRAGIGLGIWRPEDRGQGYGTDALRATLRWAFRELNLHRVELGVDPENKAAIRVYEKLGFVVEGRRREHHFDDGRFIDELMMGLLRPEFEAREDAARS